MKVINKTLVTKRWLRELNVNMIAAYHTTRQVLASCCCRRTSRCSTPLERNPLCARLHQHALRMAGPCGPDGKEWSRRHLSLSVKNSAALSESSETMPGSYSSCFTVKHVTHGWWWKVLGRVRARHELGFRFKSCRISVLWWILIG